MLSSIYSLYILVSIIFFHHVELWRHQYISNKYFVSLGRQTPRTPRTRSGTWGRRSLDRWLLETPGDTQETPGDTWETPGRHGYPQDAQNAQKTPNNYWHPETPAGRPDTSYFLLMYWQHFHLHQYLYSLGAYLHQNLQPHTTPHGQLFDLAPESADIS